MVSHFLFRILESAYYTTVSSRNTVYNCTYVHVRLHTCLAIIAPTRWVPPTSGSTTRPSRSSFALKGGTECTVPHVHSRMILTHVCTPTGYDPVHGTRMRAAWCILGYRECTPWTVVNAHTGCFNANVRRISLIFRSLILQRYNTCDNLIHLSIKDVKIQ